ncbi:MAG TPA: DUF2892 domain-containing protein [Bacteroidales bacterium]|nr:DUF2892 domain-containing protein [Bacteroidales bacterium]HPS63793.1 DUF2892 domain-containing protein [Bacteroidales bacterium]
MKKNMGTLDIVIRLIVAALIVVLFLLDVISGTVGIILLVVAAIFALTSLLRICPLYLPCGINTGKKEE